MTTTSAEAREHFFAGWDAAEKFLYRDARRELLQAVSLDPSFAMAYVVLAGVQDSAEKRREYVRRALTLMDRVSEGERLWIRAEGARIEGKPDEYRERFLRLARRFPGDARVRYNLGNVLYVQGDVTAAVEQYERATALQPTYAAPYNQLGYAFMMLGAYERAERSFLRAIDLLPGDSNPLDSYAELLVRTGRFEEAIDAYRRAMDVDSSFVTPRLGVATALMLLERHQEARSELRALLDLAQDDRERRMALTGEAVTYLDQGRIDDGLAALDRRFQLSRAADDPGTMAADQIQIGDVLLHAGRSTAATARFEEAHRLVRDSGLPAAVKEAADRTLLYNRARVDLARGMVGEAAAKLEEFQADGERAADPVAIHQGHRLAGEVALADGSCAAALEELRQAGPPPPSVHLDIARALRCLGDSAAAAKEYSAAAHANLMGSLDYALTRRTALIEASR